MGVILAFDHGARRIGVAIADTSDGVAKPLQTIDASGDVFAAVKALIQQYSPTELVVGLPRNLDGDDTEQTASARAFALEMQNLYHLPVHLQDEAVTSELAGERLGDQSIKQQKALRDQVAAQIILEDYLK